VGEGFDFPDDECRWQFLAKIPFAPPSRILKAREDLDKEYRYYDALQTMVQAFGRGMRSNRDWCESFICDAHMDWFLPRYKHLAPNWFHNFFSRVSIVPAPLMVA
jgi:Rad3-related DNA helicase